MNLLLVKILGGVALLAALVFAWNWHVDHEQGIGYQKAVAEYNVKMLAAKEAAVNWYNVRQQDYVFLVQYRVDA